MLGHRCFTYSLVVERLSTFQFWLIRSFCDGDTLHIKGVYTRAPLKSIPHAMFVFVKPSQHTPSHQRACTTTSCLMMLTLKWQLMGHFLLLRCWDRYPEIILHDQVKDLKRSKLQASSAAMLGLLSFLSLLLCTLLTTVSPTRPTNININDEVLNNGHIEHTHPSQLQRRQPSCNPLPGQNLIWADCIAAALAMPRSQEGVDYHYPGEHDPGDTGIAIIDRPLTSGGNPASLYNLPRSWSQNGCTVSLRLEPGLDRADVTYSNIKFRATMLVNFCVGGGDFLMPAAVNHPGHGGNETYKGVMIGVSMT